MPVRSQQRYRQKAETTRNVRLSLDGECVTVALTEAEEASLRRGLQPFIAAARLIDVANPTDSLPVRLRAARVRALLDLPSGPADTLGDSPLDALIGRTAELYSRSLTPATRASYKWRWERFVAWCEQNDVVSLPAAPETLMLYLADLVNADPPPSLSTVRGAVNAIGRIHLELDMPSPAKDRTVAMLMRGLSHAVQPTRATPMSALRIEELRAVCRHLENPDAVVVRDAVIARLVLAGVPKAILARLRWGDVRFERSAVRLGERMAKNGPVVGWRTVHAIPDPRRCPVAALQRWRSIAGTTPAVVFTQVDRDGRRGSKTLGPKGLANVLGNRRASLGAAAGETLTDLGRVADLLLDTAADVLRDRAMLLLGFAMAARRGELSSLVWDDISTVEQGLVIVLRRSKTDREGRGTTLGVPWGRSSATCPVRAVQAWQDRVRQQLGDDVTGDSSVFVKVGRSGRITLDQPLTPEGVTMMVKRRMTAAGIAGHWGGRSLRAGLITSCADLDLPLDVIARQSRHASLDSLVRYIRAGDPFTRNAVERVGL